MMEFFPDEAKRSEARVCEVVCGAIGFAVEVVLEDMVDGIIALLALPRTELQQDGV
jgi:hypothetical protein